MLRLNGSFPSFSPTEDLIAFNPDFDSKAGLDIVKFNSSKRWSLLKGRTTFYNSWSPTEKNVIFTSIRPIIRPIFDPVKAAMQIARVSFDLEQLEDDVIDVKAEIKIITREETGNNAFSSCSTDGKRLVFRSGRPGHKNLYILDASDGEFKSDGGIWQLTGGEWIDTMPCWSPDGKLITFSSNRHNPANVDAFSIYLRCSNGSDVRRIYVAGDEGSEEVDRWEVRGGGGGLREIRWW
ncbi:putative transcription factor WD40-like family [Helianthus annuus]|nr:putative transcription factor WD40-like family [Helianthus annuus]